MTKIKTKIKIMVNIHYQHVILISQLKNLTKLLIEKKINYLTYSLFNLPNYLILPLVL